MRPHIVGSGLSAVLTAVVLLGAAERAPAQDLTRTPVTIQTEDGWTLRGTLTLPPNKTDREVPGVLLLTEPVNRLRTTYDSTLATKLPQAGIAVLSIDMRGTAGSWGKKDYMDFTMAEREGLRLDVRAAVKYLSAHPALDDRRIGIVGPGLNANNAVLEAADNASVKALVLITGTELSERARRFIEERDDIPVLCLVGSDQQKANQRVEAEPYFLSANPSSEIHFGVQRGTNMMFRPGGLDDKVTQWFVQNLKGLGVQTPVSFTSADGWDLKGTLYMPDTVPPNTRVPVVVMVHGYNHSSEGWYQLVPELVRGGVAALTFDWRGTRKSIHPQRGEVGANMPDKERENIHLDAKAAVTFAAAQPGIDPNRVGIIAATATNNHALRAAMADTRIKTYVGLSFYAPAPDVKTFLQKSDMPILIVASLEDVNSDGGSLAETSRQIYKLSRSKESELLMFDDAGRGTGMIDKKPELKGMIVRWFQEKLAAPEVKQAPTPSR